MRMVRVIITYDMDDPEKPLGNELLDWIEDRVNLQDIIRSSDGDTSCVTIKEVER